MPDWVLRRCTLQNEIKKLSKSLSNMAVDRDILKDAVDYASKKKWI